MKTLVGIIFILLGIGAGLYVGVWWAFIGGIVCIIEEAKKADIDSFNVAFGIARVFFAGPIGAFCSIFFVTPGLAILKD